MSIKLATLFSELCREVATKMMDEENRKLIEKIERSKMSPKLKKALQKAVLS